MKHAPCLARHTTSHCRAHFWHRVFLAGSERPRHASRHGAEGARCLQQGSCQRPFAEHCWWFLQIEEHFTVFFLSFFLLFFFFPPGLKASSEVGIWGFNLLCPLLLKCGLARIRGVKITKRRTGGCRNKKMMVATLDVHRPLSCSSV